MERQFKSKELWIGLVEVRALQKESAILGDTKGAFVNIITWASDAQEYRQNAEEIIGKLGGLFVYEIENPEPVSTRRQREGDFQEEMEDMISRAECDPNAIIYGTFHRYERDDT